MLHQFSLFLPDVVTVGYSARTRRHDEIMINLIRPTVCVHKLNKGGCFFVHLKTGGLYRPSFSILKFQFIAWKSEKFQSIFFLSTLIISICNFLNWILHLYSDLPNISTCTFIYNLIFCPNFLCFLP